MVKLTARDVLLALGTVSSVGFAALAVRATQGIFDLDRSADALVGLTRIAGLQLPMETISLLGQATMLAPLVAFVSLLLWWYDQHRWALGLPLIMSGTGALQWLAKWAVDRPRPNGAPWGFPSGHALVAVVFFGVIAYIVCTSTTRRCWRWTSTGLGVLTVLAVGFSRLYLDVHWLSDVGGGFAVGGAYLPIAIWLVEPTPARRRSRTPDSERSLSRRCLIG
jgi:membrane-associated phospholipid phosphatase